MTFFLIQVEHVSHSHMLRKSARPGPPSETQDQCPVPRLKYGLHAVRTNQAALTAYVDCERRLRRAEQEHYRRDVDQAVRTQVASALEDNDRACAAVRRHTDQQAQHLLSDSSLLISAVTKAAADAVTADSVADALIARGAVCSCSTTGAKG